MPITYKIDWLTLTKNRWDVETHPIDNTASALAWANIACNEVGVWLPELKKRQGKRFYPWSWECMLSGALVSVPVDVGVQGIMIAFPGKTLGKNEGTVNLLSHAYDHGWHATRIDIAYDFIECWPTVDEVHEEFLRNEGKNSRTTQWIKSKGGNTFYLGSRHSNRMARVYDKGKEQRLAHQWTRVEVEYKGGLAGIVGQKMQNATAEVHADIASFFRNTNPGLSNTLDGHFGSGGAAIRLPPRPQSKREIWFDGQVTSALMAWASDDYDEAKAWVSQMLWRLENGV